MTRSARWRPPTQRSRRGMREGPGRTVARAAQQALLLGGRLGRQAAQLARALVHRDRKVELPAQHLAVRDGHLRAPGAAAVAPAAAGARAAPTKPLHPMKLRGRRLPT